MKIQCACGAKYEFDATPEMLEKPVKFVCPGCGLDSSDFVNELIRREFAGQASVPQVPAAETPRLRIARAGSHPAAPAEAEATPDSSAAAEHCARHPRERAEHHCAVCGKPMCRQCMNLFGHVCSPFCRGKAEAENLEVPVFAGMKTVAEAKYWRKVGAIGSAVGVLVAAGLGFWFWYAWFGSVPHTIFSMRFDDVAYTGNSQLCGTNQFVFLHGGTLARYDIESGKKVWSQTLVSPRQIADAVARENQLQPVDRDRPRIPQSELEEMATRGLEGSLQLHVSGRNIWVSAPGKLTHYDWDTGKVLQEIPIDEADQFVERNDEFLVVAEGAGSRTYLRHVNVATGESRVEEIAPTGQTLVAATSARSARARDTAGLPLAPGADAGQPMNPAKVSEQAQNLGLAGRLALPAIVANSREEERIEAELNDQNQSHSSTAPVQPARPIEDQIGNYRLISSPYGDVEFAARLLKANIVTREAMKPPSESSALDSHLSTGNEAAAANEMLNEMQRSRGGSTVQEDESLYQVSLRRPDSAGPNDWAGQVIGPPTLFPLKTVNVLTAGKTLIVFDKTNKKLWQAALTYAVPTSNRDADSETSAFGAGPCVEHGDTLYVFDQAVLTAFDLATGNARWRVPTVGVVGLYFDDHGMLYVNTTTANPENIRYSRQIDITQKIQADLLKIDPRTGRILWNVQPGGFISYLSGDFIYTVQIYNPSRDELKMADQAGITPNSPHVWIRRINPRNGQVLWVYYQAEKGPTLNVRFKDNFIVLDFAKEVDVLKYLSL